MRLTRARERITNKRGLSDGFCVEHYSMCEKHEISYAKHGIRECPACIRNDKLKSQKKKPASPHKSSSQGERTKPKWTYAENEAVAEGEDVPDNNSLKDEWVEGELQEEETRKNSYYSSYEEKGGHYTVIGTQDHRTQMDIALIILRERRAREKDTIADGDTSAATPRVSTSAAKKAERAVPLV